MEQQQQPLLTDKNESEKWHRYPSVGRTGSMIPTASDVSVDEIRSAASNDSIYPPSLHAPLISSPDPPPYVTGDIHLIGNGFEGVAPVGVGNKAGLLALTPVATPTERVLEKRDPPELVPTFAVVPDSTDAWSSKRASVTRASANASPNVVGLATNNSRYQAFPYDAGYGGQHGKTEHQPHRQILDEVEIRELLIDHVGHRCCWGSRPARTWKIHSVEDCNVYVGTLETFVEEREVITETEPYHGNNVDGKDKGPELGVWELDLRSEFPVLFTNHKESRAKIPHSETIEKCSDCAGRGDIVCATCNAGKEPGTYKEGQMTQCASCYGRGLIAHRDGSDTICVKCNGKGKLPCATCGSRGLVKCLKCEGSGSLLTRKIAVVKWDTHSTRKLNATSGAASVPDDVFHQAKGVQLCNTQAYHCTPAFFADSFFLNQFSSEVISERPAIPPTARVICERHTISVIPVTRVTMVQRGQSFSFYIIGFSRDVYLKDYYPSRFCWGCCPCLDWLKI